MTTTYSRVALADALPGDEVFQAGEWTPVAAFHVFGSNGSNVKIVFPGGGSHAMPVRNCPMIRRAFHDDAAAIVAIQKDNAEKVAATAAIVRDGLKGLPAMKRHPRLVFVATNDGARRAHYGDFDARIVRNDGGWFLTIETHGEPLVSSRFRTLKGAHDYAQSTADVLPVELFA